MKNDHRAHNGEKVHDDRYFQYDSRSLFTAPKPDDEMTLNPK